MRSLVLLALAGAVFALFLHRTVREADDMVAREEAALARAREVARGPAGPVPDAGGYRYAWEGGGDLPEVLVARPLRRGEDGARTFIVDRQGEAFEFDTVLNRAPDAGPDPAPLILYLAVPPAERPGRALPFGWARVE